MNATTIHSGRQRETTTVPALAPLIVLPAVACGLLPFLPAWQATWLLALSIYAGLKWLTFASCPMARRASTAKALGYLLFWPGMNATAFLDSRSQAARPPLREWLPAIANLVVGLVLLFALVPAVIDRSDLLAGWIGMVGLALVLHFGVVHIVSLVWRMGGVAAEPLMDFPILASSLGDFWGRRWNRAFRDVAFAQVFRPLVGRIGAAGATMAVFIVSGLIHELVISVPVRGGWGGPTLYFVLQGVGLLAERSRLGRRLGFGRGLMGRVVCAAVCRRAARIVVSCPVRSASDFADARRPGDQMKAMVAQMNLQSLIFVSGVLHFGTLVASALVPQVLDWKAELHKLARLSRQLIWVHGLFIVLTIVGFGCVTTFCASDLALRTPLARAVCAFIAFFWLARLFVQFFVFDAKPFLKSTFLKLGYHGLTLVFFYQVVVLSWAALG